MRIGVFVGSFNPPHEGHHKVMKELLKRDLVDKVLLLPTPNYWDKNNLIDINERIKMLKFYEEDNIEVDNKHNNYPNTYEVLRSLKKDYKDDTFYLVIGADNLERLHEWKNIEEVLENKIIVFKRGKIIENKYLSKYKDQFIYLEDFDFIKASSTDIRNGNSKYLNPEIKKYIEENHLYEK